jgi:D-alanyl-D-alanine carboxypeptidase (penicillin-binding protein 5/6)
LLARNIGVDGLKTGHTDDGGFGIVASANRDGRRLIAVVNGLANEKERADEAEKLLEYGFREFDTVNFFKSGETVETAEIWYGKDKSVPLVAGKDISITINKLAKNNLTAEVRYEGPVAAPVHKGDHIADLAIKRPGVEDVVIPLVAGNDVEKLGFFGRIARGISYRFSGGK